MSTRTLESNKKKAKLNVEAAYKKFGPKIYRRCLRMLSDDSEAKDAMHDVFVKLIKNYEAGEPENLNALLLTIATEIF